MKGPGKSGRAGQLEFSAPVVRFLSNGKLTTLLTASGTGYSALGDLALTRWTGDRVEDEHGFYLYLKDVDSGATWSAGFQPTRVPAEEYRTRWRPGIHEIRRRDQGIECLLETCVDPAAAAELRRITLHNRTRRERLLEITTYAETVLNTLAADAAHPAFSSLFIQTAFEPEGQVLLARRRARARGEKHPWLVHAMSGEGEIEYETDRARFLGRGRSRSAPLALEQRSPLSGTVGNVLDPVMCLQRRVRLGPGETSHLLAVMGVADERAGAVALARKLTTASSWSALARQCGDEDSELLRELGMNPEQAERAQTLAGAILYGHPGLRADAETLESAAGALDPLPIDDFNREPLALVHADRPDAVRSACELVRAGRYWRRLGLPIRLLILSERPTALPQEAQPLSGDTHRLVATTELSSRQIAWLDAVARLVVRNGMPDPLSSPAAEVRARQRGNPAASEPPGESDPVAAREQPTESLHFFNGTGGFSTDGREYVIRLQGDSSPYLRRPPLPWINVVANDRFGFLVGESGSGCTWSGNSREHRLTPWYNDPVLDPHGEALYVRDEEDGRFWSPLPGPAPDPSGYEMCHGFGYSICRHVSHGLDQETGLFVSRLDPVKLYRLRLTNRTHRARKLSLFAYQRLVLGGIPEVSGRHVVSRWDAESRALLAQNRQDSDYGKAVAFSAVVEPDNCRSVHFTADREVFIGRNHDPAAPRSLLHSGVLDNRTGPGLDPCFAQQVIVELPGRASLECTFLLGEGKSLDETRSILEKYGTPDAVARAWAETTGFWRDTLSGIEIETPARELDLMVNGWLGYQNLSCRMWGRSALYQSGGAYGYRDQLQDAAALIYLRPDLAREQILLHAAHQFVEGDVLHWWHPPAGKGLRTRFADDLLWLPLVTAHYLRTTGDGSVLEESVGYLTARRLHPGEDEVYLQPSDSGEEGTVYDHCCRAIDRSLTEGPHGLPLFGTGDWNDSMNRVGREGRGESVWMGFFLYQILGDFLPICLQRGDEKRAGRYDAYRRRLQDSLNTTGWDGQWYRRGYYDDGTPLGSKASDECQIDALVQAWSVLSGAAPPERAEMAMEMVERHLISEEDGIIRLLTPPFENTPHDPGYIKGYVPGVRENGGQYTHAALWVVRALAELGHSHRAARLLTMLSPVSHALTPERVGNYKVEPYVIAADVYGADPHVGRGGWTWYTGSAGWMFRVALESILGFRIENGETLAVKPCVPKEWPGFKLRYRLPGENTVYQIAVVNPKGRTRAVVSGQLDGDPVTIENGAARIPIVRDGAVHRVELTLG